MPKHVHYDLIKKYIEDTDQVVEYQSIFDPDCWKICNNPSWYPEVKYRVLPKPKQKVKKYRFLCKAGKDNYYTTASKYRNIDEAKSHTYDQAFLRIDDSEEEFEE